MLPRYASHCLARCSIQFLRVLLTIGAQKHNQAHCINHSCDPNCYAKILTIDGKKKCDHHLSIALQRINLVLISSRRIIIYAQHNLQKGTELTCVCILNICVFLLFRLTTQRRYDYKLNSEEVCSLAIELVLLSS